MKRAGFIAAVAVSCTCFTASAQTATVPMSAFTYDRRAPLDLRVLSHAQNGTAGVDEITFAAADAKARIRAKLVRPDRPDGSAVLFVHWLGDDPKTTNLSEFMEDASTLAARGTTSLLVDAPWSQADWFDKVRSPATDYSDSIAEVKNLRRSLDMLTATPGVDPQRVAYVGHDFGAMYGAVLSGVDFRTHWYVLAAGTTTFSEWFLLGTKPPDPSAYVAQMQPLDPLPFLARSRARGFLFQFAEHDSYIPAAKAKTFAAAAPEPKRVIFYDSDHSLAVAAARADRIAWLESQFGR